MKKFAPSVERLEPLCSVYSRIFYSAEHWEQTQRTKKYRPYARYVDLSPSPRLEHAAWRNTVLPVDDPWWLTHWPPNGWNCLCYAGSLSESDIARYGYSLSSHAPSTRSCQVKSPFNGASIDLPEGIDFGFVGIPSLEMAQRLTLIWFDHPDYIPEPG